MPMALFAVAVPGHRASIMYPQPGSREAGVDRHESRGEGRTGLPDSGYREPLFSIHKVQTQTDSDHRPATTMLAHLSAPVSNKWVVCPSRSRPVYVPCNPALPHFPWQSRVTSNEERIPICRHAPLVSFSERRRSYAVHLPPWSRLFAPRGRVTTLMTSVCRDD